MTLRRVLPLLCRPSAVISGSSRSPHRLVAPRSTNRSGTPLAVADEGVGPVPLSTPKSLSKSSVIAYHGISSQPMRSSGPGSRPGGARNERERRVPRVQVGGVATWSARTSSPRRHAPGRRAPRRVRGDVRRVEGAGRSAAQPSNRSRAHRALRAVETVLLLHRHPRHPASPGGQRIAARVSFFSSTSSCSRAASHSCGDTIGGASSWPVLPQVLVDDAGRRPPGALALHPVRRLAQHGSRQPWVRLRSYAAARRSPGAGRQRQPAPLERSRWTNCSLVLAPPIRFVRRPRQARVSRSVRPGRR